MNEEQQIQNYPEPDDGIDLLDDLCFAIEARAAGQAGSHRIAELKAAIIRLMYRDEPPEQQRAGVPDGWVLVPREPTEAMIEAAASFGGKGGYSALRGDEAVGIWGDMLQAATQPQQENPDG